MKNRIWIRWFAMVLALLLSALVPVVGSALAETDGTVRVLLTQLGERAELHFCVNCRYMLEMDGIRDIPAGTEIAATLRNGGLTLSYAGETIDCGSEAMLMRCAEGACGIRFTEPEVSNLFCGDLRLTAGADAILPVLSVYIEDYVFGVLSEGVSDTGPMEALKAQAVAARSTALWQKAAGSADGYDLTDDARGFVFRGYSASRLRAQQAADETRSQVLTANDAAALCGVTESNGGQTQSAANAWGIELDYSDVKEDPYDLGNRASAEHTAVIRRDGTNMNAELEAYLVDSMACQLEEWGLSPDPANVSIMRIISIEAVNPYSGDGGLDAQVLQFTLDVRSANRSTGKPIDSTVKLDVPTYGMFESWYGLSVSPDDSETVGVAENADEFLIAFRREGSGVGLSRCGAQTMASDHGMRYPEILDFYFPGTQLQTLSIEPADAAAPVGSANGIPGRTLSPYALPTIAPVEPEADTETRMTHEPVLPELSAEVVPTPTPEALPVVVDARIAETDAFQAPQDALLPISTPEADDFGDDPDPEDLDDEIELDGEFIELGDDFEDDEDDFEFDEDDMDYGDEIELDGEFIEFDGDFEELEGFEPDDEMPPEPIEVTQGDVKARPTEPIEVTNADVKMRAPESETYRYVDVRSSGKLTVREYPSQDGGKMGYLRRGDAVRILGLSDEWAEVETEDGLHGYVSTAYLSEHVPEEEAGDDAWKKFAAGNKHARTCSRTARARVNVRMRAEASTESEAILKVSGGKEVSVRGYDDEWAYVKYGGKTGFIMKKYLKFSE